MKYETAPAEKSTVKITMTFDAAEWAEANNQAYVKNRSKYVVNGFRKGKVPKHVLVAFYGKELFYEDALNLLYIQHYDETLEKEKANFTVVGDPALSVEDISDEKVVLVATVPVKPEVKIETYKGIKIQKFEYTVTDADLEQEIENARSRFAEKIDVTDRAAEKGDTVNIDFTGKVDGKEFDGGTAENYDLTLGSRAFIEGFEEQVAGMKIGETKEVNVTFPENYQAESLQGKPAVFTVTLHKITGKKLPALDDEFAKKLGSENVEAFRQKTLERLEQSAKAKGRDQTEFSILSEIAKGATAEIPDAMVDAQENYSLRNVEYNLMMQGVKMEDYLSYIGSTREEYKKKFEEEARRSVLQQLVLEKIMQLENIVATQEEIDLKLEEQAKSVGKSAEEYKKTIDPRQLEYIENDVKVTKTFDFLMANNEMYIDPVEHDPAKLAASKPAAKKTTKPAAEKSEGAEKSKAPAKKATSAKTATEKKDTGAKPKTTAKKKEN